MTTWTVSEARAALPEIIERVAGGEEVVLTRHGQAVAVVVRPDTLRSRRAEPAIAAAAELRELVDSARTRRRPRSTLSARRSEELVADVRTSRDSA
jgi:prevent-host-death family protein